MSDVSSISLRSVTPDDAAALADIYGYYVAHTAVSFEYVPPTAEEFRGRISHILENYPGVCGFFSEAHGENSFAIRNEKYQKSTVGNIGFAVVFNQQPFGVFGKRLFAIFPEDNLVRHGAVMIIYHSFFGEQFAVCISGNENLIKQLFAEVAHAEGQHVGHAHAENQDIREGDCN